MLMDSIAELIPVMLLFCCKSLKLMLLKPSQVFSCCRWESCFIPCQEEAAQTNTSAFVSEGG